MGVSSVTGSSSSGILDILELSTTSLTTTESATSSSSSADSVSISSSGSAASGLLELVRRRASLVEARNNLVSSAMENGGSTDSMETQLEDYDSQISELDERIAEAKAAAVQEQADSTLTYANNTYARTGGTSSSADALHAVAGLSARLSVARTVACSMSRLDRQTASLQVEIKADEARGLDTADKETELEELEALLAGASDTLSASLDGINQTFE